MFLRYSTHVSVVNPDTGVEDQRIPLPVFDFQKFCFITEPVCRSFMNRFRIVLIYKNEDVRVMDTKTQSVIAFSNIRYSSLCQVEFEDQAIVFYENTTSGMERSVYRILDYELVRVWTRTIPSAVYVSFSLYSDTTDKADFVVRNTITNDVVFRTAQGSGDEKLYYNCISGVGIVVNSKTRNAEFFDETGVLGRLNVGPDRVNLTITTNREYVTAHTKTNTKVVCYHIQSGQRMWERVLQNDDQNVFVSSVQDVFVISDKTVMIINPETGRTIAEFKDALGVGIMAT
jgi:hypothetical protein